MISHISYRYIPNTKYWNRATFPNMLACSCSFFALTASSISSTRHVSIRLQKPHSKIQYKHICYGKMFVFSTYFDRNNFILFIFFMNWSWEKKYNLDDWGLHFTRARFQRTHVWNECVGLDTAVVCTTLLTKRVLAFGTDFLWFRGKSTLTTVIFTGKWYLNKRRLIIHLENVWFTWGNC